MALNSHFRGAQKEGHRLADFAGRAFRRQRYGGLMPSLEYLLVDKLRH
jgi:hypothetical protein